MGKDSSGSCRKETKPQQDFSWVVKANDRPFHDQFSKRHTWCLKKRKYANNAIKTAKYNVFSFLPLNLFEQFHRLVNVYFLSIILLQTVPQISTLPWFALLFPLAILLGTRGIRDLMDDIVRHQSDWEFNNRPCEILTGKSFSLKKWRDIHVGDIVRICKDSFVPADLLLLSSSEPNSLCYVETMDIDGETNLKYRQALLVTHEQLTSEEAMANFDGIVTCEEPNSQLNSFIGTLEWHGEKYALDGEKILLRGCRIRNTEVCYGLVIYAGFDTKIMKNSGKVKMKKTKLIHLIDRLVLLITVVLLLLSFGLAICSGLWAKRFRQNHSYLYLFYKDRSLVEYAVYAFFGFIILFSLVIPMSMLITFEFIYLINSCFINWDVGMYYAPKDMPAKARSTSLNDQLGQIEYIFSDKTGTLTQNIMTFKKCCISGKIYGSSHTAATSKLKDLGTRDQSKCQDMEMEFYDPALQRVIQQNDDPLVREFMRLLALCHTVMVEEKDNNLVYQAASPDEEALVSAARDLGYVFLSRTQDTITIRELGVERTYKVLALLDFNSVRKRMSVLVQDPEGCIKLYTKGADTVILERLQRGQETEGCTIKALDSFAEDTLRTLCLAAKDISKQEYASWSKKHYTASILLQDRASELDKVYEEIEKDLVLLGVTAIEDKLQEGVPETIALLKRGNIKVWVLTGDKQETAVNIGFACQLLSDDMTILEEEDICEILEPSWHSSNSLSSSGESLFKSLSSAFLESPLEGKKALVVTGDFLDKIFHMGGGQAVKKKASRLSLLFGRCAAMDTDPDLGDSVEKAFVELAATCQAVICCRVTPKQKALVVQMVKKHKRVISLAIGDGANDVNMIKTADIGVGISGQEGMQAVQCSDYAMAQFSFLQRLLFVHGRWAYLRICKFLRYFFFKTFASMMVHIWFAFYTGFTAQPLLESWFLALYNVFYTSLPVLCLGLFEQDVSAEKSLKFPELYEAGQKNRLFNVWTFCVAFVHGSLVSLCNFYVTFWAIGSRASTEIVGDYQSFGSIVATSAILIVIAEISMEYKYWNIFSVCSVVISFLFFCLFSYLTQCFGAFTFSYKDFAYPDATLNAMMDPTALLVVLLCVVANITPSLAVRYVNRVVTSVAMSKRLDVCDMQLKPRPVELTSHIKRRNTARRRSSYAFSHKGGYADLISKGASLKVKGPRNGAQRSGFSTTTTTSSSSSLFKGRPELANVDPPTPETVPPLKS